MNKLTLVFLVIALLAAGGLAYTRPAVPDQQADTTADAHASHGG